MEKIDETKGNEFRPGKVWLDKVGKPIESHLGGVLFENGTYYWYGTNFDGPTVPIGTMPNQVFSLFYNRGVTIYSSEDLYNWTFEGLAMHEISYAPGDLLQPMNVLIRPKVIKNDKSGKFVMMVQIASPDLGIKETLNDLVYAVADSPVGPFDFKGLMEWSTTPNISGLWGGDPATRIRANDIGLYKDDDGRAYIMSSREDFYLYELSDDYLSVVHVEKMEGITGEAPAVFKWQGTYFILRSQLTGWAPNRNFYATAPSIHGPWTERGFFAEGPGGETTFDTQTTFVLPVHGRPGSFIYIGDRFNAETTQMVADFRKATHVWLPLELNADNMSLKLRWREFWDLTEFGT